MCSRVYLIYGVAYLQNVLKENRLANVFNDHSLDNIIKFIDFCAFYKYRLSEKTTKY